jgi:HEPN domain-containing protein
LDNIEYAQALLLEAEARIDTASSQVKSRRYAYVVRQSQEAVELSLKAALRLVNVDFPKQHEVSDVLLQNVSKYPSWFSKEFPTIARISRELYQKRIPSMYGEESNGKGPSELFSRDDAREASNNAGSVYRLVMKLYRSISKQ